MDLESLHQNFVKSQSDSGNGTLTGLANLLKGSGNHNTDPGTTKIPLTLLPVGVKPGQRISLTVTGIDAVTGMATIVPDAVQNAVAPPPTEAPEAPGVPAAQPQDSVDRAITMGPMDGLKSYLFQKTREQENP